MLRIRHRLALLTAGLLLLQAMAVAHAFDHHALDHANHDCAVCLHGHGGADPLPADTPALPRPRSHARPAAAARHTPVVADTPTYRSRAPPSSPSSG